MIIEPIKFRRNIPSPSSPWPTTCCPLIKSSLKVTYLAKHANRVVALVKFNVINLEVTPVELEVVDRDVSHRDRGGDRVVVGRVSLAFKRNVWARCRIPSAKSTARNICCWVGRITLPKTK